jgi:protein O-GlcNAc transferase
LTLMGLGRWDESAEHIRRVALERPDDPYARFNLGLILSKLGRYGEAVPELQRAAQLSPADPEVFTELGIALLRTGDAARAETALRQALALDPDHVAALFNLGQCYERLGRHQDSLAVLEQFSRASGSREKFLDEKRLFRAAQAREDSLAREGKDALALEALLAYRDSLAEFPQFQQELGVAYLRTGRRDEAIAAFERAVKGDPGLTEAHAQLAVLYQQAGEADKAMKARQSAARRHAEGPQPAVKP